MFPHGQLAEIASNNMRICAIGNKSGKYPLHGGVVANIISTKL